MAEAVAENLSETVRRRMVRLLIARMEVPEAGRKTGAGAEVQKMELVRNRRSVARHSAAWVVEIVGPNHPGAERRREAWPESRYQASATEEAWAFLSPRTKGRPAPWWADQTQISVARGHRTKAPDRVD